MNADLFKSDPRSFALDLVENQLVSADDLLLCALKYMSSDEVRDMLDSNELSPRFDEDEDEDEDDSELENWLHIIDDGDHDIEAIRIDFANGNIEIDASPDRVDEYRHENIVLASMMNGQFTQAKKQCKKYGLEYRDIKAKQK